MIDQTRGRAYFYRIVISPKHSTGESRDLPQITRQTMRELRKILKSSRSVPFVAVAHTDHSDTPHVHALAVLRTYLTEEKLTKLREACEGVVVTGEARQTLRASEFRTRKGVANAGSPRLFRARSLRTQHYSIPVSQDIFIAKNGVATRRQGGGVTAVAYNPARKVFVCSALDGVPANRKRDLQMTYNPNSSPGYQGYDHYCGWLDERGYHGTDWFPPDVKVREAGAPGARTRFETLVLLGRKPALVPDQSLMDGINTGRKTIPFARFDKKRAPPVRGRPAGRMLFAAHNLIFEQRATKGRSRSTATGQMIEELLRLLGDDPHASWPRSSVSRVATRSAGSVAPSPARPLRASVVGAGARTRFRVGPFPPVQRLGRVDQPLGGERCVARPSPPKAREAEAREAKHHHRPSGGLRHRRVVVEARIPRRPRSR